MKSVANLEKKSLFSLLLADVLLKSKLLITNSVSIIVVFFFSRLKDRNSNQSKILCINTEKLGDLILASDFLNSIGSSTKFYEKQLLIPDKYSPIYDWEKLGFTIITLNKRKYKFNPFYRAKFILNLKSKGFSKVINFTPERGWINDELALCLITKQKIALKADSRYLIKSVLKYFNKSYQFILYQKNENEYERLINILNTVRISVKYNTDNFNEKPLREELKSYKKDSYLCIAPFASDLKKTWGIEEYKILIETLSLFYKIVILGNRKEIDSFNKIRFSSSNISTEIFDLPESIQIIKKSLLFIGNDSGFTHIAHNLNIPTIAIIGGGEFGRFFPYKDNHHTVYLYHKMDCSGCGWNCIYKERYCLTNVSIDEVLKSINDIIINKRGKISEGS